MNAHTTLAAAGLMLAVLTGAACSPSEQKDAATTSSARADSPDVHRFRIGTLDAIALREGGMSVPNNNTVIGVGRTPAEVAAVLSANNMATDAMPLSIQPLLVRTGGKLVLLDAGAGTGMGADAGKLPASLAAAGVDPSQITDVLISHSHGDHVGGLVGSGGALTFPNATIRMTAAEWTYLQGQTEMAALVAAITPKVQTFQPGAVVAPGITAVAIDGHTPGHTGYEIASGGERLLYIGDTMHQSVISVQRPDWQIAFDGNAPTATASRKALLQRAASENLRLYAVHFPYPGLGRIQKRGEDYVWVAETTAP